MAGGEGKGVGASSTTAASVGAGWVATASSAPLQPYTAVIAPKAPSPLLPHVEELKGTLEAILLNEGNEQVGRMPVHELVNTLKESEGITSVVFDGIVTGRLIDTASEKAISMIVGERVAEGVRIPRGIKVRSFRDL